MDPADLRAWRKGERARLVEARMALTLDEHQARSEAISANLATLFAPESFGLWGGYWPFRREYDCLPFLRQVIAGDGRAALPVVVAKNQPLEFRCWTPEAKMEAGVWNILHPAEGPAVWPTALLVALVGFDEDGYRLGYGSGYYDRTLAIFADKPVTIGVGFELSRLPTIHPQPHDLPMDYIVTEAGVMRTGRTPA